MAGCRTGKNVTAESWPHNKKPLGDDTPSGLEGHHVKTTHCSAKASPMNKKPTYPPRIVAVSDKHGDELQTRMAPPRLANELIDGDRAAIRATTVRDDLQAARRRPLDAPMATKDDPSEMDRKWWDKWQFAAALIVWSLACFALGKLA